MRASERRTRCQTGFAGFPSAVAPVTARTSPADVCRVVNNDPKEGLVTSLASEFRSSLESNIARSRAVQAAMDEEIARREALGISADHPDAKLFAEAATAESQVRAWPQGFEQPVGWSRRVYAVADRLGRSERFLGYEDDPETVGKILDLSDAWRIRYDDVFEDSCSDEWLGRAVAEPGSPERVAAEREAWDDYEFAKLHREEVAADRFEYRGNDARSGFGDATERQRRQRNDHQLQLELERGAEVLGDERHRAALRERRRFRAYVEAFDQDPDAPEIQAWRKAKGYAVCVRALRAKALREGVLLPSVR